MDAERKGRLWTLFRVFFKISAVSVGGGLTMLPLMSREFSEERKWITEEEMVDVVAIVQSVPGIIAVNMAILIGQRAAGLPGVFAASVGVVLPPVIVILAIAALLFQLSGNETMDHIFLGVRAAVSALILLSVIKMSRSVLKGPLPIAIALIGFLLLVLFDVDAVGMIVGAAVVGLAMGAIQSLRRNRAAGGAAK